MNQTAPSRTLVAPQIWKLWLWAIGLVLSAFGFFAKDWLSHALWGFAACLAYVAFFAFYRQYLQDQGPMLMVLVMGVALLAAFVAFLVSLLLVRAAMNQA